MISIQVRYKVKMDFITRNKANIEQVMQDLRALNHPGIKYAAYLMADGQTFLHFAEYASEEAKQIATGVESFKNFQQELKASHPVEPPRAETLQMVAAMFDKFS